jgi:hypothetical protein
MEICFPTMPLQPALEKTGYFNPDKSVISAVTRDAFSARLGMVISRGHVHFEPLPVTGR